MKTALTLRAHSNYLQALYLLYVSPVSGSTYAASMKRSDDTWNALQVALHYERALAA